MPAVTFEEILKFNPYHDERGRFATSDGAKSTVSQVKSYKQRISELENKKAELTKRAMEAFDAGDYDGFDRLVEDEKEVKATLKREKQAFMDDDGERKLREYADEVVREQESSIRNLPKERAIIVSMEGDVVFEMDGDETSVVFDSSDIVGKKGMIFTHNHPDNPMCVPMLSPGDVDTFANAEFGEMRAASQKGPTYSIKRKNVQGDDAWFFSRKYEEAWDDAMEYKTQKLNEDGSVADARSGKITSEELYRRGGAYATDYLVKFCQSNAEEYGLEFKVENAEVK